MRKEPDNDIKDHPHDGDVSKNFENLTQADIIKRQIEEQYHQNKRHYITGNSLYFIHEPLSNINDLKVFLGTIFK